MHILVRLKYIRGRGQHVIKEVSEKESGSLILFS